MGTYTTHCHPRDLLFITIMEQQFFCQWSAVLADLPPLGTTGQNSTSLIIWPPLVMPER